MASDFSINKNGFLVREGVLVKFNPEAYDGSIFSVVVPEGVTEIGNFAFTRDPEDDVMPGIDNLVKVTLPKTCTILRSAAFYGNHDLDEVVCLSPLEIVEGAVFSDCNNFHKGITLPKDCEAIPCHLYDRCNIHSACMDDSIKKIEDSAFYDNVELKELKLNNVEEIEANAFYHCCSLKDKLILGPKVKYVGYEAFANCTGFTSIRIENKDIDIDLKAFSGMTNVTTIEVPKDMKPPRVLWGINTNRYCFVPDNMTIIHF